MAETLKYEESWFPPVGKIALTWDFASSDR